MMQETTPSHRSNSLADSLTFLIGMSDLDDLSETVSSLRKKVSSMKMKEE